MGFSLPATFPTWDNQGAMAELLELAATGKIRLIVDRRRPLSEAAVGHAHLSNRGAMGKVLLLP
jgi:NADPH:quinone reductase-like Zn-dependent oxidoreductase